MDPVTLSTAFAAVFGAVYGSFLNVVIHRLPREESVVFPASRCPRCKKAIAWHDNVPVLSWLILRGRARCCRKPISARYPLVEAVMAALAAAAWRRWGGESPAWAAVTAAALGVLLAVTLIDWDHFIIPDELSLGLAAAGPLVAWFNPLFDPDGGAWWLPFWWSARGAAFGFLITWGVAATGEMLLGREAMGGGDIKLMAGIGAWTGMTGAFDCLMVGSFLGSVYGVWLIASGRSKRTDPIPFGPFLAAGAALNFFVLLPVGWPLV